MVENTNSTILEVQGSFGLTYMVGIIPLNLRSQETNQACHTRARRLGRGVARRGEARRGRQAGRQAGGRGVVVLIFSTH